MSEWFEKAVSQPWPFIALLLVYGLWKAGKTIGIRLFEENDGIIPVFLKGLREDSASLKKAMVSTAEINAKGLHDFKIDIMEVLHGSTKEIQKLETQLVTAIQARPNDEDLHRALFTESPIPICYVSKEGIFTRTNEACSIFLGYSAGELASMTFQEITDNNDIAADVDNVERVASGTLSKYRMSKTYLHKNGNKLPADLHVFRYPENGTFIHFISIIIPRK